MKLRRKDLVPLAIIVLIISFPVEGLAAPKLTIKPRVSASWRVDSNFYKAEAIDREVSTYLLQPGIDLGVETAKGRLSLDYTMNDYIYEEPANKEDYLGHTATFMARYRAFDRLLLGLDNSYYKTRDPARLDELGNTIARDKYSINRLTPSIFYDFGPKFSARLRYRNTETDYDDATREDSTENRGMLDMVFNFTRLTSLDLEYQRWKRDYGLTTSDYTSDQIKLIYRKQFKYFSFEAGGGRQERSFDVKTLEKAEVLTYRIAIIGQNPPAPERPRSHIRFAAEQNLNQVGAAFKASRFSLDAGHIFLEKILAGIGGYYQISDYETTAREDKTYDISGRVGYMLTDWLTFSLTAGYEERDSNVAGYDYDNTYYLAKLDLVYNLGTR